MKNSSRTLGLAITLLLGTLTSLYAADDDAGPFQKRINAAIARGKDNLMGQLPGMTAKPPGGYPMGRLALPLAAALKGGASAKDPVLVAAFNRLAKMPPPKDRNRLL